MNLRMLALFCLSVCLAVPAFAQSGSEIFKANCEICHGADGLGNTQIGKMFKIVSFKDSSVIKAPNSVLMATIKNGKNKMPPFKDKLSDAQIGDVVTYIRTLQKK